MKTYLISHTSFVQRVVYNEFTEEVLKLNFSWDAYCKFIN